MSLDDFNKAFVENPDGVGYSWFQDGKVHFRKGLMLPQEAWDFGLTLKLPFTVHFRASSTSLNLPVIKELTHPFIVSKDSPLDLEGAVDSVLFHNGTEHNYKTFGAAAGIYLNKDEICSDSRMIARIIADGNERFLQSLNSKFVLADIKQNRFFYYGNFVEENGIWFSNLIWRISNVVNHNHSKKKTQKSCSNSTTHFTNTYNYKKPWESSVDTKTLALRYLLNKITENAAKKLWNKYVKKQDIWIAQDRAIKILKQQNKTFDSTKIEKYILNQRRVLEKEQLRNEGEKKLLTLGELKDENFSNLPDLTGIEIKDTIFL